MNILLTCCLGMSTSMLVESMLMACEEQGKNYYICAVDNGILESEIQKRHYDVILLGPQIRHMLKRVCRIVNDEIPVAVIHAKDYGELDGETVLKYAEDLVEQFYK